MKITGFHLVFLENTFHFKKNIINIDIKGKSMSKLSKNEMKENLKKVPSILFIFLIISAICLILNLLSHYAGVKLPIANSILDGIFWACIAIWCIGTIIYQSKS